jgi:hypothetical protein
MMRRCSSGETVDIPVISPVTVVQGKGGREWGESISPNRWLQRQIRLQLFQMLWAAIKNLNREILCVRLRERVCDLNREIGQSCASWRPQNLPCRLIDL